MKMPTSIAVTIRILPMLAAAVALAATVDAALAMAAGKHAGSHNGNGRGGMTAEFIHATRQPIGKPLPPMNPGRGNGHMSGNHSHDGWSHDHERRHHHRRHHSRDESRELYKRGVVPPILMVR